MPSPARQVRAGPCPLPSVWPGWRWAAPPCPTQGCVKPPPHHASKSNPILPWDWVGAGLCPFSVYGWIGARPHPSPLPAGFGWGSIKPSLSCRADGLGPSCPCTPLHCWDHWPNLACGQTRYCPSNSPLGLLTGIFVGLEGQS